jgi:hypothetical protein
MATADGREDQIVADLERHPPDWVVIISRSLIEFNILRYGEQHDNGQQLLRWVGENYDTVIAEGGDPLDYRQRGVVLLTRKNGSP